ncbi:MAG: gamma-glutamylcyclotransferase [Pseudomonadota bacterium]
MADTLSSAAVPAVRDAAVLLAQVQAAWERSGAGDLWVFGYASLIWRPEFPSVEQRAATVHGWHRALKMRSRINRGTLEHPGLVFALLRGGACRGMAYRLAADQVREELPRLWLREMPTGVYDARWVSCRTGQGPLQALAFTLPADSPNHTGALSDEAMLQIFATARGRYGTTLDYLLETAAGLRRHGIKDAEVERLVALAQRLG